MAMFNSYVSLPEGLLGSIRKIIHTKMGNPIRARDACGRSPFSGDVQRPSPGRGRAH